MDGNYPEELANYQGLSTICQSALEKKMVQELNHALRWAKDRTIGRFLERRAITKAADEILSIVNTAPLDLEKLAACMSRNQAKIKDLWSLSFGRKKTTHVITRALNQLQHIQLLQTNTIAPLKKAQKKGILLATIDQFLEHCDQPIHQQSIIHKVALLKKASEQGENISAFELKQLIVLLQLAAEKAPGSEKKWLMKLKGQLEKITETLEREHQDLFTDSAFSQFATLELLKLLPTSDEDLRDSLASNVSVTPRFDGTRRVSYQVLLELTKTECNSLKSGFFTNYQMLDKALPEEMIRTLDLKKTTLKELEQERVDYQALSAQLDVLFTQSPSTSISVSPKLPETLQRDIQTILEMIQCLNNPGSTHTIECVEISHLEAARAQLAEFEHNNPENSDLKCPEMFEMEEPIRRLLEELSQLRAQKMAGPKQSFLGKLTSNSAKVQQKFDEEMDRKITLLNVKIRTEVQQSLERKVSQASKKLSTVIQTAVAKVKKSCSEREKEIERHIEKINKEFQSLFYKKSTESSQQEVKVKFVREFDSQEALASYLGSLDLAKRLSEQPVVPSPVHGEALREKMNQLREEDGGEPSPTHVSEP